MCHLWTAELLRVSRATGEFYRLSDAARFLSDLIEVSVECLESKVSRLASVSVDFHPVSSAASRSGSGVALVLIIASLATCSVTLPVCACV